MIGTMQTPAWFDHSLVPEVVFDEDPALVDLYRLAWELAAAHVTPRDGAPQSPYMDEAFDPDTIWIWDTCLMAHFAKYAPEHFPGAASLDNFYGPMYDGAESSLRIQHPDNPPLFAWSELEHVRHTGDLERVRRVLGAGYLQRHFEFFETVPRGSVFPYSRVPTAVERTARGYRWNGISSGMDNSPRGAVRVGGDTEGDILWLDAAAQQALAAGSIAALARLVGDASLATEWSARHAEWTSLVQDFWDDDDRIFYDRQDSPPYAFHRVRTPAVYWPLLAGACTDEQAAALADALTDPRCFGGTVPWPSVARDDPAFRSTGHYWRGGVWIPSAYVSAKGLAAAGHGDVVRPATLALLRHMAATAERVEPHTIWECYSPDRPTPSTGKDDEYIVRPDFCGWSALAPIAMLIEHVLRFQVDAPNATVTWDPTPGGANGVRRLRCGPATVSAVAERGEAVIEVDAPLTLVIGGRRVDLAPGVSVIPLESPTP